MKRSTPIRRIDSINYIHDHTRAYCGAATIAMLADVNLYEAVELMQGERDTKQNLKKALDY